MVSEDSDPVIVGTSTLELPFQIMGIMANLGRRHRGAAIRENISQDSFARKAPSARWHQKIGGTWAQRENI